MVGGVMFVEGIVFVDAGGVEVLEFWSQPTKAIEPNAQTSSNRSEVFFIGSTLTSFQIITKNRR